jgi:hypothetical protein
VHVLVAPDVRVVGAQASDEITVLAITVRETVWDVPRSVAVKVTGWFTETVPAWAVKVAVSAFCGTATDVGTDIAGLLLVKETAVPPGGAALVKTTMQVVEPPEDIDEALHVNVESRGGGSTATEAVLDIPPKVAVTTTVCVAVTALALALNAAVLEPAETLT